MPLDALPSVSTVPGLSAVPIAADPAPARVPRCLRVDRFLSHHHGSQQTVHRVIVLHDDGHWCTPIDASSLNSQTVHKRLPLGCLRYPPIVQGCGILRNVID